MRFKDILSQVDFFSQSREYGIFVWQHPQFLFLINGIFIILLDLAVYLISLRFFPEEISALIVLFFTAIFFAISYILTKTSQHFLEINKLKSEFLDIMTHEIKNPLTAFNWILDFLIPKEENEQKKEYLLMLKENSQRIQHLLKDLLIFSREEEFKIPTQKQEFSVKELIENILQEKQKEIFAKNLTITFKSESSGKIFSWLDKVKIVISNLIENAITYSKERGKIEIELKDEKNEIFFKIKDEGIGIPQEDQRFIFQRFFRAKNAREKRGTGLGLYISQQIIKKLKGQIGFKSKEGEGSEFYFSLPKKT